MYIVMQYMYTVCVCVCVCVQVFSEAVTAAVAYKHKSTDFLDQVMQELEVTYMLLCLVCLFDLACFFLSSFSSLI